MTEEETFRRLKRIPYSEAYELVYRYRSMLRDGLDLPQVPMDELEPYGWTEKEFREEMKNPHPELWTLGGIV